MEGRRRGILAQAQAGGDARVERPQNNRMQLTGSARCEGGHAPPPQLIRVFSGQA